MVLIRVGLGKANTTNKLNGGNQPRTRADVNEYKEVIWVTGTITIRSNMLVPVANLGTFVAASLVTTSLAPQTNKPMKGNRR